MGKFEKSEIVFMIVALLSILVLTYFNFDIDLREQFVPSKQFHSEIDGVRKIDSLIVLKGDINFLASKDIFNFKKEKKIKPKVVKREVIKRETADRDELIPFRGNKLSYIFYVNGKAKISVNGKSTTYSVGDMILCGNKRLVTYYVDDNSIKSKSDDIKPYEGQILSIHKRTLYISFGNGKALRVKTSGDPAIVSRDLVPISSTSRRGSTDNSQDDTTEEKGGNKLRRR